MAITRGYSFSPNEQVTPDKLRSLVEDATVYGISWSAIDTSLISFSVGTGFSKVGAVVVTYEPPATGAYASTFTGAELSYLIRTPTGECNLFKNGGFETNRFWISTSTIPMGRHLVPQTAAGVGTATILAVSGTVAGYATSGVGLGGIVAFTSRFTSSTAPSSVNVNTEPYIRATLRGFAPVGVGAGNYSNYAQFHRYIWGPVGVGNTVLSCSQVTHIDKLFAINLSTKIPMNANVPAWVFGGPIWRV